MCWDHPRSENGNIRPVLCCGRGGIAMTLIHAERKVWTVDEYLRLFEHSIIPPTERVELIEGEIVRMAAMGPLHKDAIIHSNEVLVLAFHTTHRVACQVDVCLGEYSCPEPDFTVMIRDLP